MTKPKLPIFWECRSYQFIEMKYNGGCICMVDLQNINIFKLNDFFELE